MRKHQKWIGLTSLFALLFSMAVSLSSSAFYYSGYVNSFLGLTGQTIAIEGDTNYYPSAYGELNAENADRLMADEKAHSIRAMHEGTVMLRNENGALPLSAALRSSATTRPTLSIGPTPGTPAFPPSTAVRSTRPLSRRVFA